MKKINVLEEYRKMLEDVEEAIKEIQKLMKSTNEDVRISASKQFIQLIDIKASIVNILAEFELGNKEKDRNPLSRRTRLTQ